MGKLPGNSLLNGLRGSIGKEIVFKQYKGRTIVSSFPDMSRVKPSKQQKESRSRFKEAVEYAKSINNNPERKQLYLEKVKEGESVYHYALREYLRNKRQAG